jgi:hypothetical protein
MSNLNLFLFSTTDFTPMLTVMNVIITGRSKVSTKTCHTISPLPSSRLILQQDRLYLLTFGATNERQKKKSDLLRFVRTITEPLVNRLNPLSFIGAV